MHGSACVCPSPPGVKMFVGGTIGEHGKLQLEAEPEGIPIEDLVPHLTETLLNNFGATLKPEWEAEHKRWQDEQAAEKAAAEAEAAEKAAKKAAAAAAAK